MSWPGFSPCCVNCGRNLLGLHAGETRHESSAPRFFHQNTAGDWAVAKACMRPLPLLLKRMNSAFIQGSLSRKKRLPGPHPRAQERKIVFPDGMDCRHESAMVDF